MSPLSLICHLQRDHFKFSFFRQCLGGTICDKWDVLADAVNETLVNFMAARDHLIAELVRPTDLADQRHYLETSKKPYRLNCQQNDVTVTWCQR